MGLFRKDKRTQFAVLGLGRFGSSLAQALSMAGNDVLAVDIEESKVNAISDKVTRAIVADISDDSVIASLSLRNMDAVIVCIGTNMQSSILTTMACKEENVPYVICKANSEKHKTILEKLGADLVVVPELDMANKLAVKISNPLLDDIMSLTQDFSIIEILCPEKWVGLSLAELDIRRKHEIMILLVKNGKAINTSPGGDFVLQQNDILLIGSDNDKISKFMSKLG